VRRLKSAETSFRKMPFVWQIWMSDRCRQSKGTGRGR
jgi:hypothetical protein